MSRLEKNPVETLPVVILDGGVLPEGLVAIAAAAVPALTLSVQDNLASAVTIAGEGPIAVVHSSLADAVTLALQSGCDPDQALTAQTKILKDQIKILRGLRRQCLLLDRAALQMAPAASAAVFAERLGNRFDAEKLPKASEPPLSPTPAYQLLATLLLRESPVARKLEEELRASMAVPPVEVASVAILTRLHAAISAADNATQTKIKNLETQLLQQQQSSAAAQDALTKQAEASGAEIEALITNISHLEAELIGLQDGHGRLKSLLAGKDTAAARTASELVKVKEQAKAFETERDVLTGSMTQLEAELIALQDDHGRLENLLANKDAAAARTVSELTKLKKQAKTLETERDVLTSSVAGLEAELTALQDEHGRLHAALASKNAAAARDGSEQARLIALLEDKTAEIAVLTTNITQLETEMKATVVQFRTDRTALEKRLSDSAANLNFTRDELENLAHRHATQSADIQILGATIDDLRQRLAKEVPELAAQRDSLSAEHANLVSQLAARDTVVNELKAQVRERSSVAEKTAKALSDKIEQLAQTKAALQQLKQDCEQKDRDLHTLSTTLTQVYGSNSWKITGPLRRIINSVRKSNN